MPPAKTPRPPSFFRDRREELELTQRQVGDYCKTSQATIYKIEYGRLIPKGELLRRLLEVLKVDPADYFKARQQDVLAVAVGRLADANEKIADAVEKIAARIIPPKAS